MSGNIKNTGTRFSRLIRYLNRDISGNERNSFERELQRDPFAEEALEGLSSLSAQQAESDLRDLTVRLKKRSSRRNYTLYYSIAASVAVLMVISTVFIMTQRKSSNNLVSEAAVKSEPIEIQVPEAQSAPKTEISAIAMAEKNNSGADRSESRKGASVTVKGTATGAITDAGGNFTIGVSDNEKRTLVASFIGMESKEFESKADTQMNIALLPSSLALNEVVVVGYGSSKKTDYNEAAEPSAYTPPRPVNGKASFDKYIEDNIRRPDTLTAGQRVVVVISFTVGADGKRDSYKIIRSPGKQFSDEALRLIKSGPEWKPAEEDGKVIVDEVRMRIVFR